MRYFVTGAAGFIGSHVAKSLLEGPDSIVLGFDGMTDYYDVQLKRDRIANLTSHSRFDFVEGRLEDWPVISRVVSSFEPDIIIHLAAQAGVRYSIEHPRAYMSSNLEGTFNVLEAARHTRPRHLLFASTSSVYGSNEKLPFSERDSTHNPVSLYAATKKSGEVLSHSYSHLFDIPTTCFRFFTVYGPWGRPDMAPYKFVSKVANGQPIDVYGEGRMARDFTFVDDLVVSILKLSDAVPVANVPIHSEASHYDTISNVAPWRVVNIAGGEPVELMDFINAVEKHVGREAIKNFLPMQPGDVRYTNSDTRLLRALTGQVPATTIDDGVEQFVRWYRGYYDVS